MVYNFKNKVKTVGKAVGGLLIGAYMGALVACSGVNNVSKYDLGNNNNNNNNPSINYNIQKNADNKLDNVCKINIESATDISKKYNVSLDKVENLYSSIVGKEFSKIASKNCHDKLIDNSDENYRKYGLEENLNFIIDEDNDETVNPKESDVSKLVDELYSTGINTDDYILSYSELYDKVDYLSKKGLKDSTKYFNEIIKLHYKIKNNVEYLGKPLESFDNIERTTEMYEDFINNKYTTSLIKILKENDLECSELNKNSAEVYNNYEKPNKDSLDGFGDIEGHHPDKEELLNEAEKDLKNVLKKDQTKILYSFEQLVKKSQEDIENVDKCFEFKEDIINLEQAYVSEIGKKEL